MEFKELIEARRSVRKYVPGEISKDEMAVIVGEAVRLFMLPKDIKAHLEDSGYRER